MHLRIPLILWRSMALDMLRLIALTAGVAVCVVAFAASVKPLADGKLEPAFALKYTLLAIPPMLAYVLPFAGGFAATFHYHRLAADNEILAAQAGGLGLRTLLVPALVIALFLGGGLALLNDQAIPRFLRAGQRLITLDFPRFINNEVQRGRSVEINQTMVYAKSSLRADPERQAAGAGSDRDPEKGTERLSLSGVAAIQLDPTGKVTGEMFATRGDLWFFAGDQSAEGAGISTLLIRLRNAVGSLAKDAGTLARFRSEASAIWSVPDFVREKVAFLTWGELKALEKRPENINWVDFSRRDLAFQLARGAAEQEIQRDLADKGQVLMKNADGQSVVVRASGVVRESGGWRLIPPAGKQEVEVDLPRAAVAANGNARGSSEGTTLLARGALLTIDLGPNRATRRLEIRLDLTNVRARASNGDAGKPEILQAEKPLRSLSLASSPQDAALSKSSAELLEWSDGHQDQVDVRNSAGALRNDISRLLKQVLSKRHERLAMAASCGLLVLTGALTALRFSKSQPLHVYLWTFFPALGCVVTISGGQQTVLDSGPAGLFLLWAGVAGLAGYTLAMYLAVAKH